MITTNIDHININECTDIDLHEALTLTTTERDEMHFEARQAITQYADEFLDKYAASLLGDGHVIGPVTPSDYDAPAWDEEAREAFREHLGNWDASTIIERWGDRSEGRLIMTADWLAGEFIIHREITSLTGTREWVAVGGNTLEGSEDRDECLEELADGVADEGFKIGRRVSQIGGGDEESFTLIAL